MRPPRPRPAPPEAAVSVVIVTLLRITSAYRVSQRTGERSNEPLSNLDATLRVNTRNELIKQHHRLGSTMIYVTHDQVEAMTMGTRICVMNEGRVAQIGAPLEVYWQPADTFVARFLGSPPMNLFTVPLAGSGGSFHIESPALRAPLSRWAAATLAPST